MTNMGKELLKELIDKGVITLDDIDNYLDTLNKSIINNSTVLAMLDIKPEEINYFKG